MKKRHLLIGAAIAAVVILIYNFIPTKKTESPKTANGKPQQTIITMKPQASFAQ